MIHLWSLQKFSKKAWSTFVSFLAGTDKVYSVFCSAQTAQKLVKYGLAGFAKSLLLIKCKPQKQTRTEENISMKDKTG